MKSKIGVVIVALLFIGALTIHAQILTVLHQFTNGDGAQPFAGVTVYGNTLFGATTGGGTLGQGDLFSVNTNGAGFTVVHNFDYTDGAFPRATMILSGSNLYAPTYGGGNSNVGTIFSISTSGAGFTNLYQFNGVTDGADPRGGIVLSNNVFYGTAQYDDNGGGGNGELYSIQTNGSNYTNLFVFAGTNGSAPYGDLLLSGNVLYGTTYSGGAHANGEVFSIHTDGTSFAILHSFTGNDGANPAAGLVLSSNTLYGTASGGGASSDGTLFSVQTNGSNFTVIHTFTGSPTNGISPDAGLFLSSNVLYGTTTSGGGSGGGSVFSINTDGTGFRLLYSFTGNNDGGDPEGPVILSGNSLYGTTAGGGFASLQAGGVFGLQISGLVFVFVPIAQTNLTPGATDISFGAGAESLTTPDAVVQYQWRLNGVNIPNATTSSKNFDVVEVTNCGNISVIASDGSSALSSPVVPMAVSIATVASGNDNFTNRYQLASTPSGVVASDNTTATREAGEPFILPGNPGGKSIWFQWHAPVSGTVIFTTQGSGFDTIMGAYIGTNLATLTQEPTAVNDDDGGGYLTSEVTFSCVAGSNYNIVVDGYRGASGNVALNWSMLPDVSATIPAFLVVPPAQTVVSNGASVTFICTASSGVPTWYFNGQPTGVTATNYVIASVSDTNVGEYVAEIPSGGGVAVTQPAHLQTSVAEDGTTETNSVALNKFLDSANSGYSNPIGPDHLRVDGGDTRGFSVSQVFSTVGATAEPGEPSIDGQIGGSPVWYTYVSPTNGALLINTAGSSYNTMLGVFGGSGTFATLTNIGAGYTTNYLLNGQPQVYIPNVPKGQTNYIVVDGYNAASGTAHLNINLGNPLAIITPLPNQYVVLGGNATFNVGAIGSTPLYYSWRFNGTNIAGANNSTLTITNAQATNVGTYTVIVSNLVSSATNSGTLSLGTLPSITTQPLSHTIVSNSTASLSVTATGTATLAYQWLFNGTNVGTNGALFSVPNFQPSNQGSYSVMVSNPLGTNTSSNAIMLLNLPLRIGTPILSGGAFNLQLVGAAGSNYILQASSNLVTWTNLATNSSVTGLINLTDSNAANFKSRFYRAITN